MSENAEALAQLQANLKARDELADRLANLLRMAQVQRWQISDEDWLAIDAASRKLEQINSLIVKARELGLDPGLSTKTH